jgi:hypothetical protein
VQVPVVRAADGDAVSHRLSLETSPERGGGPREACGGVSTSENDLNR